MVKTKPTRTLINDLCCLVSQEQSESVNIALLGWTLTEIESGEGSEKSKWRGKRKIRTL